LWEYWRIGVLTGVQIANLAGGPALISLIRVNLRPAVRFALVGIIGNLILSSISIARLGFTGAVLWLPLPI
jgi:hypothetical protein